MTGSDWVLVAAVAAPFVIQGLLLFGAWVRSNFIIVQSDREAEQVKAWRDFGPKGRR